MRKTIQWQLHGLADSFTEFALRRGPRSWTGWAAIKISNGLDRMAANIGGHTW